MVYLHPRSDVFVLVTIYLTNNISLPASISVYRGVSTENEVIPNVSHKNSELVAEVVILKRLPAAFGETLSAYLQASTDLQIIYFVCL